VKLGQPIVIPDDFWKLASNIQYWGYSFEPNEVGTYDVTFLQRFDAKPIIDGLRESVASIRSDACSYFHTRDVNVVASSQNTLSFSAGIEGKKRTCDDLPFGGQLVTDLGDIGGSVTGHVDFLTVRGTGGDFYQGAVQSGTPVVEADGEVESIFGI